jgi:hypothetical protein
MDTGCAWRAPRSPRDPSPTGTPYLYYDVVGSVGQPGRGPDYGYLAGLLYGVRLKPDLSGIEGIPVLCVEAD